MGRAPCCDRANVKRGPWSPEEDSKLKDYIEKYGSAGNWIALPHKAGLKRCGKSCRLRWLNYLRPNIKHGEFTEEDDRIICSLFSSIGSKWSIIAAQLPGRTDNDIKNYWNTKLRKKLIGNKISYSKRKPNQHQNHQLHHQNSFAYDPINFKTPPSSTNLYNLSSKQIFSSGVEGIPTISTSLSSELIFSTSANYPFVQSKQLHHHHHQYLFGSKPSCSSSTEGSCTQNISFGSKELDYVQNYLYGEIDHQCQKLIEHNGMRFNEDPASGYCDGEITTKALVNPSSSNINNNNNNNVFLDDPTSVEQGGGLYFY